MKHVIEVTDLVKVYRAAKEPAVNSISFSVAEGSFFSLLGPNGAGKTTTISILTTTLAKTSGKVLIAGYDIDTEESKVRRNIGVIFQQPSLDQNLTAEENIRIHAIMYGLYPFRPGYVLMPDSYKRRLQELTSVLGIEKELFKPIKSYSGGMKRKLEIVRSLMHNPKILFLDEPTTGLDPLSRKNLWEYLQTVRKQEKTTIFLTTHYLEESEGADHVAIINHGRIISHGTPAHIKQHLLKSYVLVDAKDRKGLIAELQRKKIEYEEGAQVKILLNDRNPAEVVQSLKTPLNALQVHAPTLEEAYLEIVDEKMSKEQEPL